MTWDLHETWVRSSTPDIWLRPGRTNRDTSPPPVSLLNTDWDGYTTAAPISNADMWDAMGASVGNNTATFPNASIVVVAGRGKVYNHFFSSGVINGTAMNVPLPVAVDEATMSYDMRWLSASSPGLYGWGGKLPGLAGVAPGHGNPPSGGSPNEYGWACRSMWITPDAGYGAESPRSPVEWIGYFYHPLLAPGSFGVNKRTGKGWEGTGGVALNAWVNVKQYHKMNTVAVDGATWGTNGIHRMWWDGVLVYEATNVVYRKYTAGRITHFQWALFYGGGTVDWAPTVNTNIQIDNLTITTP